ncbi:MAG: cupin domain-containing protein [Rhizobacter sp.]|nr:cupin domain-containing protein [Ferruginibacter sp.]
MTKKLIPKKVFINPAFKDKVTVLHTSEETGGAYSMGLLEISPGGGNPMHTHSEFEETFTAHEGVLGVALNGKKHYLSPGESITVPRNEPHHFFNNTSEKVSCFVKFVPGHENFIKGLAIGYGLAGDNLTSKTGVPKSLGHLAIMICLMDTKPTGILGLLFPVFKWMAGKARKNGTEQLLLEKYYYASEKAL